MDIEGAEKEVFEHSAEWIDRVMNIIIEVHDDLKPGCAAAVRRVDSHFPHRYDNGGAGTRYMQREVTPVPAMPAVFKGGIAETHRSQPFCACSPVSQAARVREWVHRASRSGPSGPSEALFCAGL